VVSVAYPTTASPEVAALADEVRAAAGRGEALRIVGAGTWLDAGRPVRARSRLELASLAGVIEYVPGDLTITVRAGTTLERIAELTAAEGQWLALDPYGSEEATIGAVVATASAGPLAAIFGAPRDQVLGLEFVTGDGAVARGGGRVVKNVAGFDLVRLVTGAWGTLGIVTEVTLRLRARPERDVTLLAPVAADPASVDAVTKALRALPFSPFAAELVDAALAKRVALGARPALLVRLGGSASVVRAQRDALMHALGPLLRGPIDEAPPEEAWSSIRGAEFPGAAAVRFSAPAASFATTWDEATYVGARVTGSVVSGSPLRGVVRASLPGDEASLRPALSGRRAASACARVYERLPAGLWSRFAPSAVSDRLSQSVKHSFDPRGVLNPGILGD